MAQTRSIAAPRHPAHALSALRPLNYRLRWFGALALVMAQVAQSLFVLEPTHMPLLPSLTGLSQSILTITHNLVGGTITGIVGNVLVAGADLPSV